MNKFALNRSLWLTVFAAILSPAVAAQCPAEDPKPKLKLESESQRVTRVRCAEATALIERTASEAPLWDDRRTSIRALTDAADVLWQRNPERARTWLRKAWGLIGSVPDNPKNEKLRAFFTRSERGDSRSLVLRIARRHDAAFADSLLSQLPEQQADRPKRAAFDDRTARSEELLAMAQHVLAEDPHEAFALASQSLADGVSYSLQNVLTGLREKNVQMANTLFDLALARFSSGSPDPSEAHVLAGYLFKPGFTFSANSDGQAMLVINPAHQSLQPVAISEPERARLFLAAVYQVLLSRPLPMGVEDTGERAAQLLVLGNRLAAPYHSFTPELAPAVMGFLAQIRRQVERGGTTPRPESTDTATGKRSDERRSYQEQIEHLVEKAERASNPVTRKLGLVEAALSCNPQDYQRARRILQKIEADEDLRTDAVSFVLYRAALSFLNDDRIENASELVPQIENKLRRAVVKLAIAQRLAADSVKDKSGERTVEHERALALLDEIDRDLARESTSGAAKTSLGRLGIVAMLDPARALGDLAKVVDAINKVEGFDLHSTAAPDLGLTGFAVSGATVAASGTRFDFRTAVDPLILSNFEDVAAAAERFQSKELRGTARLEVGILYLTRTNSRGTKTDLVSR